MRMNRPRPSSAALPDHTGPPVKASPWRWAGAEPDPSGRLQLPPPARRALADDARGAIEVDGVVRGDTLVLRPGTVAGRDMTVDARGRIYLPLWLRRHSCFLIGTHNRDAGEVAVVVVPAVLFDTIGDRLLKRIR